MDGTTLEKISEAVHNGWMDAKKAKGVTSRKLDTTGEELLRPYAELSEEAKDLDRGTVRSVLEALPRAGYVIVPGGVAMVDPKPQICAPIGRPPEDRGHWSSYPSDGPAPLSAAPNHPGDPRD